MSPVRALLTALSDPDAEQARRLLQQELSDRRYEAARPTWFDLLSRAVADWFASLSAPDGGGGAPVAAIIGVAVIAAIVACVLFVTGVPHVRRRSSLGGGSVLDPDDQRSAHSIRAAAAAAAERGAWDAAITEAFRALVRQLSERTIVLPAPGTTARGIAERAAAHFEQERIELRAAADEFDRVRYLGLAGDERRYDRVRALDARIAAARPVFDDDPVGVRAR